jgi:hypothetical protein
MTHVSNRSHVPDFLLSVGAVVEFDAHSDALDGDIVVFDGVDGSSSLEWMKSYIPGKVGWMDSHDKQRARAEPTECMVKRWVRFSGPSRPSMP